MDSYEHEKIVDGFIKDTGKVDGSLQDLFKYIAKRAEDEEHKMENINK